MASGEETYAQGPEIKRSNEDESGAGMVVASILWFFSILLAICTFPFSLMVCVKMVQEYERAIIFRLGRIKKGGAVGPGLFLILPCIDDINVTDLRVRTYDVNFKYLQ